MSSKPCKADEPMPLLVTAAVIYDGENVLITRRPEGKRHAGFWEFPGGKVDPGESPEIALKRELLEELDVVINVDRVFEVVYYRYEWGAVLVLAYACQLLSGPLRNLGVAEHRWVAPTDLESFSILPADKPIIERLVALAAQ